MNRIGSVEKLRKASLALVIGTLTGSSALMAGVPSGEPICPDSIKNLKAVERGTGVILDKECRTAYVTPPAFGKAELVAMTRSSNLTFCPAVNNAGATSSNTVESAKIISEQIRDMLISYKPLNEEVIQLRQKTSDARAVKETKESLASTAKNRANAAEATFTAAAEALRSCRRTADLPDSECAVEIQAKADAKAAYNNAYDAYSEANAQAMVAVQEYKMQEGRMVEQQTRYVDAIKPLTDLQASLIRLSSSVLTLYREYARLEGTTGQILYTTEWSKLVNEYKTLNADLPLTFTQMPIADGNFTFSSRLPSGTDDLTIPALLSASVPGVKPMGAANFPTGERLHATGSGPAEGQGEIGEHFIGFGNAISGQIVLSLNGACPYFDSPTGAASNIDAANLAAHMVVNMQFAYDVQHQRHYTSQYNLANMTDVFERHKEEGGLFDTTTINEKIVNNDSSDWFSIEFGGTSAEVAYTDKEKTDIRNEEKMDLISRGLRQMAVFTTAGGNAPGMPGVIQSGAGKAASEIQGTCGLWVYCAAGGLILGTLDSIFGDKEAVSHFKMNNNVWVSNEVRDYKMVRRWYAMTFRPDAGF